MTDEPRTPCRHRDVEVNGVRLAVTEYDPPDAGAPALVALHGIGSRAVSWWPVVDALTGHFHLYAPDLRGHGGSDKPGHGYLLPDYAADLANLLDAIELQRPLLLGHSLGGLIVLEWARAHPNRAAAIALEDTALSGGARVAPAFDGWLALSRMSVAEAAAYYAREHPTWTAADCLRRARSITATAPAVFEELRDDALQPNPPNRIAAMAAIRSPVLLIHGDIEAGGMVGPADAKRFAAAVPQAKFVRLPGVGHNVHRDAAQAFLAAVVPFLLNVEGSRSPS